MNWLDKLKIALLEQDDQKAFDLIAHLPDDLESSPLEEKMQALELIQQTKDLLESKQLQTQIYMEQIKAAKKFLEILD
ncbi:hypothetical protein LS68_008385 [Helicobacter sp. MIT 05-5293]|uniref:hypothetical protein n=1 Tax=Helicobacter sp. MIT 05-5293 TaxID=1548149 RepID=UPI00051D839E|nr:hypothetical protein [Helicobacter sp. MIT 05-5293]TLD80222.1 hypothetical protein LS68_008385 [Helicobacter sp. MIT 05-5293]